MARGGILAGLKRGAAAFSQPDLSEIVIRCEKCGGIMRRSFNATHSNWQRFWAAVVMLGGLIAIATEHNSERGFALPSGCGLALLAFGAYLASGRQNTWSCDRCGFFFPREQ